MAKMHTIIPCPVVTTDINESRPLTEVSMIYHRGEGRTVNFLEETMPELGFDSYIGVFQAKERKVIQAEGTPGTKA